jgi:hypothetical protein
MLINRRLHQFVRSIFSIRVQVLDRQRIGEAIRRRRMTRENLDTGLAAITFFIPLLLARAD